MEYPEEEELKTIREWKEDYPALLAFIKSIWHWPEWGWTEKDGILHISTGGWSGNEDIIGAMKENTLFWMMTWESSRRGGHYTFKLG